MQKQIANDKLWIIKQVQDSARRTAALHLQ